MVSDTKLERTAVTRQRTFWRDRLIELSSLQALLRPHRPLLKEFFTLMRCRTREHETTMICETCGVVHHFDYHCNKRFCPCCAWQLSCERRVVLENCQHLLKQPKHVVLTARNDTSLHRMMTVVLAGVRKLRRREIFADVRGGWASFEVTNESKGWHVHAHLLIDSPFIDAGQLAREWGGCVAQDFAIVKLKCCCGKCGRCIAADRKSYLAEVTKYTVKPSVFIKWTQQQREEFVRCIRGRRLFFAFGHIAEAAAAVRLNMKLSRRNANRCCANQCVSAVKSLANSKSLHKVRR